jgi:hypothetical protein
MSKLPRQLLTGGYSVALISRQVGEGTLAHRPGESRSRKVWSSRHGVDVNQSYVVTACAGNESDADEAYLLSAAWADHRGADACPEDACFPDA